MQKAQLIVQNVCPLCRATACVQFLSVDGKELHVNCLDCNKVYSAKVIRRPGSDAEVAPSWREVGDFTRI